MKSEFNPSGLHNIGDPYVLHAKDGKYYLYATSNLLGEMGFYVWSSDDFKNWKNLGPCYLLNERSFGFRNCWAPEVVEHNGKYIMHYTSRWKKNNSLRIGVAISDTPNGPFVDVYDNEPMFDPGFASIDGDVFMDDDGRNYLYFSSDCCDRLASNGEHQSHIYVVELDETLTKTIGEPKFLFGPTLDYESHITLFDLGAYKWNEGPFALKINDEIHIMYSGNYVHSKYYCICCAKGKSPMGPFEKYDKPIASYIEGKVLGPGHNSVFKDDKGQMYCAYHVQRNKDNYGNDRELFIDKLDYVDGKLTMKITYND